MAITKSGAPVAIGVSFPFGLTVLTMAYAIGHISGWSKRFFQAEAGSRNISRSIRWSLMSIDTISISRIGRRSGPRV